MSDRSQGEGQGTIYIGEGDHAPLSQETPPFGNPIPPRTDYTAPQRPNEPQREEKIERKGHKHGGMPIVGPVLLIGAGTLFLLNNLEILPWSVWGAIWRLWPLILVSIGLDMLLGRRNQFLSGLIVLGMLGGGIVWLSTNGSLEGWHHTTSVPLSVPLDNAKSATIKIDTGDARLTVKSGASTGLLAEGTMQMPVRAGGYRPEIKRQGDGISMQVAQPSESWSPPFWRDNSKWDMRLAAGIPLTLDVSIGSGNTELDLRELSATNLSLDIGSGDMEVVLPSGAVLTEGKAEIGSGDLKLYIPEGVSADIEAETGSGEVRYQEPFRKEGNRYILGNPSESRNRVVLRLQVGSGDVELRQGLP